MNVSNAIIERVPIERIVIGPRRRQKMGRLRMLAQSIEAHGLIHPILLRGDTLVAGHRRLEACRLLNWKTIPARQVGQMSDEELRAVELEENTARENLSTYETSVARLAQIRQAEADLRAKAELAGKLPKKSEPKLRGRPSKDVTQQAVADATGVSPREQNRTERHVELADRYPFMKRAGWLRTHVLDAGEQLERLSETDRSSIAALLDQDAIPPKTAIDILVNVGRMDPVVRREIFAQARSEDSHIRVTALTRAAAVPPPVDPGLTLLGDAKTALHRAAKVCRTPDFTPVLETLAADVGRVYSQFQEVNAHARRRIDSPATNGGSETTT